MSAVTPCFTRGIAEVLTFGQRKYGRNNWMGGLSFEQTLDSLERHLLAWKEGEEFDVESGIHHLYHVGCNTMFLAHFVENYDLYANFDDRAYAPAGLRRYGPHRPSDSPRLLSPGSTTGDSGDSGSV